MSPAQNGFDFELHYGLSTGDGYVLNEILDDLASNKHIHNWDEKKFTSPVNGIIKVVRGYQRQNALGWRMLLALSTIEEVLPSNWTGHQIATDKADASTASQMFFTKTNSQPKASHDPSAESRNEILSVAESADQNSNETSELGQGRIIYIPDNIPYAERCALLIIHVFCIRFQNEDYGYLQTFIERHLSQRSVMRIPYHWQQTSPPMQDSSQQIAYRRVTHSCHVTFLMLKTKEQWDDSDSWLDCVPVCPFESKGKTAGGSELYLFRSSASVLLTLGLCEESSSREEEIEFLQKPNALWTVLALNCHSNYASHNGARDHLTPIAQYISGIASSLSTQKVHAHFICASIKERIKAVNTGDIFDDENFSKSILFHWAIRTCNELSESIASTIRFIQRSADNEIDKLCRGAHNHEKIGVEFWSQRLKEEIFELQDLEIEIAAMRTQVQESSNALLGVTAVLEARTALQQGRRMKTLAYLATVYLPLTATTSVYSMSVLPSSATLPSFFVVFLLFFIFTIVLVVNNFRGSSLTITDVKSWSKDYLSKYLLIFKLQDFSFGKPSDSNSFLKLLFWFLLIDTPIFILRCSLHEIYMPNDRFVLWLWRNNPRINLKFHPAWIITDLIRAAIIPAWMGLALAIVVHLVIMDVISGLFHLITKQFH